MTTVADKLAKKSTRKSNTKQVRLRLVYIDFWSAVKISFLVAIAVAVATVVSLVLIYLVLESTNVIDRVDELFMSFSDGVSINEYLGFSQVLAFAGVLAILDLIVITVLGAIAAGIYNLVVKVTGGMLVGFTSN